jgi:hypothetical protein
VVSGSGKWQVASGKRQVAVKAALVSILAWVSVVMSVLLVSIYELVLAGADNVVHRVVQQRELALAILYGHAKWHWQYGKRYC